MTNTDGTTSETLSPTARRRKREKSHRLTTLLEAAELFFADEGYHSTSISQIAEKAEVSVGTVYFYFENKEDLLIQLLDQIAFQLRSLVGQRFRNAPDPVDGIRKASHAFFEEFCAKQPAKLAIIFRESVGQSDTVEEHRRQAVENLASDIKNALRRLSKSQNKEFRSPYALDIICGNILGTYEHLAYQYFLWNDSSPDPGVISTDAVDFTLGGVSKLLV